MIEQLIARTMDWRNLPGYRLEPRFDPFIAHFLPHVVARIRNVQLHPSVLPELPLQRGMLYGAEQASPNKSTKVDFTLFSQDRRTVMLVEVKTDDGSRRDEQDDYLAMAKQQGWRRVVEGVIAIAGATADRYLEKYDKLLCVLNRLGYVSYEQPAPSSKSSAIRAAAKQAKAMSVCNKVAVEVLFVQPNGSGEDIIAFPAFADALGNSSDPLAPVVAAALRRLVDPAGTSAEGLFDGL